MAIDLKFKFLSTVWILIVSATLVASDQPNIVFILADDLGYNDVGYSKYSDVDTPHIDRLKAGGLELSNSYVPFICTPSRAALMTGQYPFRYGFQKISFKASNPYGLHSDMTLLPRYLQHAGYQTHMVGKWHIGYCTWAYTPLYRGFDTFRGFYHGHLGYIDHKVDSKYLDYWWNHDLVKNDNYSTLDFANYTVNLLKTNKNKKPMFLYLSIQSVHAPLQLPEDMEVTDKTTRGIYRKMVTVMDDFVKTVVDGLKESGKWDNTILIFSSDNGGQPEFGGNNYPLRGTKHTVWEGGTKIRSFLAGKVPKGKYNGLFHNVDWLPTILSMAKRPIKTGHIDGVDQWPALQNLEGELEHQPRQSFVYHIDDDIINGKMYNSSAVRLRFRDEKTNKVRDYKLIRGFPGDRNGRYKFNEMPKIDKSNGVTFPDGVLYDMSLHEEDQEKEPVEDEEVMTRMLGIIQREKDRKYKYALHDTVEVEKSKTMRYSDGTPILKPGWC